MTDGRRNNGGPRPGAGRPKKAEKYAGQIAATEDRIADRLPQLLGNLLKLANGGFDQIEEKWLPAELVTKGSGEFESRVFPDLPAQQPVLVERKKSRAAPDRAANIYLVDRILGKPTAKVKAEIDVDGLNITDAVRDAAAQELAAWQQQMIAMQSSWPSVSPAPPTSPTPME